MIENRTDHQQLSLRRLLMLEACKAGYHHALAGEGFHPAYETATPGEQEVYETGRMMAITVGAGAYWISPYTRKLEPTEQAMVMMLMHMERGWIHPQKHHARAPAPDVAFAGSRAGRGGRRAGRRSA